jgi:hypothetical protein
MVAVSGKNHCHKIPYGIHSVAFTGETDPETPLMGPSNLSHNVPAAIEAAKTRLTDLAALYLMTEVAGQSQATMDAKHRGLHRFLAFYHQLCGHDRPEEWFVSVTKAFLKQLRRQRLPESHPDQCWQDRGRHEEFCICCTPNGVVSQVLFALHVPERGPRAPGCLVQIKGVIA